MAGSAYYATLLKRHLRGNMGWIACQALLAMQPLYPYAEIETNLKRVSTALSGIKP